MGSGVRASSFEKDQNKKVGYITAKVGMLA